MAWQGQGPRLLEGGALLGSTWLCLCVCAVRICQFCWRHLAASEQDGLLSSDVPTMHEKQAGIHAMAVSHAEFCKPWKTGRMGPWDHPGTLRANRAGAVSVGCRGKWVRGPSRRFRDHTTGPLASQLTRWGSSPLA